MNKRIHTNAQKISKKSKRNRLYTGILLAVIVCCGLMILPSKIVSSASTKSPQTRYFKSVEIQPGDSLWSIAAANYTGEWESMDSYIKEIQNLNGLTSENIHAGNYIAVPYYEKASEE